MKRLPLITDTIDAMLCPKSLFAVIFILSTYSCKSSESAHLNADGNTSDNYFYLNSEPRVSPAFDQTDGDLKSSFKGYFNQEVKVAILRPNITQYVNVEPKSDPSLSDLEFIQTSIYNNAKNGTRIFLPKAKYVLDKSFQNIYIHLKNLTDIAIDGSGSEIIIKEPGTAFYLNNVKRFELKNFIIKYDFRLATAAQVSLNGNKKVLRPFASYQQSIDENNIYHQVTSVYPLALIDDKNQNPWPRFSEFRWLANHSKGRIVYDSNNKYFNLEDGADFSKIEVGQRVAIRHFDYKSAAVLIHGGEDISIHTNRFHSVPGVLMYTFGIKRGLSIFGNILNKNGDDPLELYSASNGALNLSSIGGDIQVLSNTFQYHGDDSLHIHGLSYQIIRSNNNTITMTSPMIKSPFALFAKKNEPILFYDKNYNYLDHRIIEKIIKFDNNQYTIQLNKAIELPNGAIATRPQWNGQRSIVSNNNFGRHNGRGIVLQAASSLIFKNYLYGTPGSAIWLATGYETFREGSAAVDVTIHENNIENVNFSKLATWAQGSYSRFMGAITISTELDIDQNYFSRFPVHQGIIITENNITNTPGPAIQISSCIEVKANKNKIHNANTHPNLGAGNQIGRRAKGSIFVFDAKNISIDNNELSGSSQKPSYFTP